MPHCYLWAFSPSIHNAKNRTYIVMIYANASIRVRQTKSNKVRLEIPQYLPIRFIDLIRLNGIQIDLGRSFRIMSEPFADNRQRN